MFNGSWKDFLTAGGKTFADGEFGEFGNTEKVQFFHDVLPVYIGGFVADV